MYITSSHQYLYFTSRFNLLANISSSKLSTILMVILGPKSDTNNASSCSSITQLVSVRFQYKRSLLIIAKLSRVFEKPEKIFSKLLLAFSLNSLSNLVKNCLTGKASKMRTIVVASSERNSLPERCKN